jgi:hypothetical protein
MEIRELERRNMPDFVLNGFLSVGLPTAQTFSGKYGDILVEKFDLARAAELALRVLRSSSSMG